MSDRGRLAGVLLTYANKTKALDPDQVMDLADYLIEKGYGVVHVAQATALEKAADAIDRSQDNAWWTKKDFVQWLCNRALDIYEKGTRK